MLERLYSQLFIKNKLRIIFKIHVYELRTFINYPLQKYFIFKTALRIM